MHKHSPKIQTYSFWKFQVNLLENNSDNRKITAAVQWKFITRMINLSASRDFCSQLTAVEKTQSAHDFFSRCL